MSGIDKKKFVKKFSTRRDAIVAIEVFSEMVSSGTYDQDALQILKDELINDSNNDLPIKVLAYLNKVTNSAFKNTSHIEKLCKALPNATLDQFESIILFKFEKWGHDEVMSQYLTPATLFGSKNKFKTYLDEATNHWIKKAKDQALKFAREDRIK